MDLQELSFRIPPGIEIVKFLKAFLKQIFNHYKIDIIGENPALNFGLIEKPLTKEEILEEIEIFEKKESKYRTPILCVFTLYASRYFYKHLEYTLIDYISHLATSGVVVHKQ